MSQKGPLENSRLKFNCCNCMIGPWRHDAINMYVRTQAMMEASSNTNTHRRLPGFRTTKYTMTSLLFISTNGSPSMIFGAVGAVSEVGHVMRKSFWPSRALRRVWNALELKCTGWMVPEEDRIKKAQGSKAVSAKTLPLCVCWSFEALVID